MARLLTAGAETNDLTVESVVAGATPITIVTSPVRTGSRSFKVSGSSGSTNYFSFTGALGTGIYARAYIQFDALPSSTRRTIFELMGTNGTCQIAAFLNSDGTVQLAYSNGSVTTD